MIKEIDIIEFIEYEKCENVLLIDARTPLEYDESHIKDAINLYALSNEERKEVGILYKISAFDAKKLGASYIAKNASTYLQNELKNITPKTKIYIYCSRGGQRSGGIATILDSIGFRVFKLRGGYKSYRNYVLNYLDNFEQKNFLVLDGLTGSGKSEIIREFENSIDLETLANHYGSSFGGINGKQPGQKQFQNSLFDELRRVKKYDWVLIEGESKKIGKLHIPSKFYQAILNSPRIYIKSSTKDRVKRIVKYYKDIDKKFFERAVNRISSYIQKDIANQIKEAYNKGDLEKCATLLLEKYYDKTYKYRGNFFDTIEFKNLDQIKEEIINISSRIWH